MKSRIFSDEVIKSRKSNRVMRVGIVDLKGIRPDVIYARDSETIKEMIKDGGIKVNGLNKTLSDIIRTAIENEANMEKIVRRNKMVVIGGLIQAGYTKEIDDITICNIIQNATVDKVALEDFDYEGFVNESNGLLSPDALIDKFFDDKSIFNISINRDENANITTVETLGVDGVITIYDYVCKKVTFRNNQK